jgi:alpha-N-acetylglucosaminidase
LAWEYLLNATIDNPGLLDIPTFHHDMVDITRQVFANTFITLYNDLLFSWDTKNVAKIQSNGLILIDFLTDLDAVLATDPSYILGRWIGDSRRWAGGNKTYADFLEYNARNQVLCMLCMANLPIDNAMGSNG